MRYGFTTGSCAAAASKAAAYMLFSGVIKDKISIMTPKGIRYEAQITDIVRTNEYVSCAVIKDGGDDPDVTTGAHIVAKVSFVDNADGCRDVIIKGGRGVGRVTKPGLDQSVGEVAINHVPREMITAEVTEVCELFDIKSAVEVEISIPEGEELAAKTFNPRLGIEGGISVIGTSGIVEPMSTTALLETIRIELSQKKALGYEVAAVSPGNYGLDFMKATYNYDLDKSVKCSNFIGATIDMARELGFRKMLLTGHIGKLIKVAGGIMNTHSKEGDCRMEIMSSCGILAGADRNIAIKILDCISTEEAVRILKECGLLERTMTIAMDKIQKNLNARGMGEIQIETIMYANQYGLLAISEGADEMLNKITDR